MYYFVSCYNFIFPGFAELLSQLTSARHATSSSNQAASANSAAANSAAALSASYASTASSLQQLQLQLQMERQNLLYGRHAESVRGQSTGSRMTAEMQARAPLDHSRLTAAYINAGSLPFSSDPRQMAQQQQATAVTASAAKTSRKEKENALLLDKLAEMYLLKIAGILFKIFTVILGIHISKVFNSAKFVSGKQSKNYSSISSSVKNYFRTDYAEMNYQKRSIRILSMINHFRLSLMPCIHCDRILEQRSNDDQKEDNVRQRADRALFVQEVLIGTLSEAFSMDMAETEELAEPIVLQNLRTSVIERDSSCDSLASSTCATMGSSRAPSEVSYATDAEVPSSARAPVANPRSMERFNEQDIL